ncbi:type IX secretion system sortase PorU [Arundinibacter roseus]|uniref:Type IX secretion system sortase PorU n=1 Tax=Arundinibacter roseus TaxID=2070510 RepID=A0A4R4KLC1_9BACT|nr:type IX secretion system sortase PorU [Arundinibacter roseus]TDB69048.1 type IX secretion system sortase PorU [Arundinibacter roseus]
MHWWKNVIHNRLRPAFFALLFFFQGITGLPLPAYAQSQPSVLATGTWYKIAIPNSGIYRLDAQWFKKQGLDVSGLNPKRFQIYGNGGSMLPQSNHALRPQDLRQNAILVIGQEDNRFDATDAVFFYAEGPHVVSYDSLTHSFTHETNAYSDSSYYYFTIGQEPGLRIATRSSQPNNASLTTQFDDYWFQEDETVNLLQSGREWWGTYLGLSGQHRIQLERPGIIPGSAAQLRVSAIASAQVQTSLTSRVNGTELGQQTFGTVSTYRYDLQAQRSSKSYPFTIPGAAPASLDLQFTFTKNGQTNAQAYLDFVALHLKRELRRYADQQLFRFLPTTDSLVTYGFQNITENWQVWDLSDPLRPVGVQLDKKPDASATFGASDGANARLYVGFSPEQSWEPVSWQKVLNQNLHQLEVPELLIVTPEAWKQEANRLAEFRQTNDLLTTAVVTTEQIFNEFSAGKPDPTAIRDFVKWLYDQNPATFNYLLLFGDATYDYKNRSGRQSATQQQQWVPVYQSRESLHPVYTYSSDDYFGFLENHEGEWLESTAGDHTLDIGVGRLPAKTREEARRLVDKLIRYGSAGKALGKWRNTIHFVADDGDSNIHQQHADALAKLAGEQFLTQRLFVDAFSGISSAEGNKKPELNRTIRQKINDGTLILNYTGHGGVSGWAEEQILTLEDMQNVHGLHNMPLLLTATCEFGRYDDPSVVSGAELMVLSPRGAAIGALTTTRPVFSSTNFSLNEAFYQALNQQGRTARLGDLIKSTKNNSLRGSLNRNFALLGDPSMRLAQPEHEIYWTSEQDTLRALKKITLHGSIRSPQEDHADETFDGTAFLSIYDKPKEFRTLGLNGPSATYREHRNKLFEGKVSVKKGQFSCTFIVPRNIDYRLGKGRVDVYALRQDSLADAGGQLSVWVGGDSDALPDREGPSLQAYINDPDFQNGQAVPSSSVLWIKAYDPGGISVSSAGLEQNLTATLNDSVTFLLNDYYQADLNDYQRGTIRFPLDQLLPGNYVLRIIIRDIYTNPSELTLRFSVGLPEGIRLSNTTLFPNPFYDRLSFSLTHNRPQEDVELVFQILSLSGQILQTFKRLYYTSDSEVNETIEFSPANPLQTAQAPIYLYMIQIRSLKDHSTDRGSGKLIHAGR